MILPPHFKVSDGHSPSVNSKQFHKLLVLNIIPFYTHTFELSPLTPTNQKSPSSLALRLQVPLEKIRINLSAREILVFRLRTIIRNHSNVEYLIASERLYHTYFENNNSANAIAESVNRNFIVQWTSRDFTMGSATPSYRYRSFSSYELLDQLGTLLKKKRTPCRLTIICRHQTIIEGMLPPATQLPHKSRGKRFATIHSRTSSHCFGIVFRNALFRENFHFGMAEKKLPRCPTKLII